jgi:hypothetical protein
MGLPVGADTLAEWRRRGLIPPDYAPAPPPAVLEEEFMQNVIAVARAAGWLCYHPRDSRKSEAGYPDLTLVRDRLLMAELKTDTGRLTAPQRTWVEALRGAGVECHIWRPADWPAITEALR